MVDGLKYGNVESAKNAIEAMYRTLRYAAGRQNLPQFEKNYFEDSMSLMQYFMEAIDDGAISIVTGSHTQVDDDDFISQSSYEQHWQDKGKEFFENVAKNILGRKPDDEVKGVEEDINKAKKERAILERKAAAFDEIAEEMKGVYPAIHALDGTFGSDEERKNVSYTAARAVFSLGVISQIISQTKRDTV